MLSSINYFVAQPCRLDCRWLDPRTGRGEEEEETAEVMVVVEGEGGERLRERKKKVIFSYED